MQNINELDVNSTELPQFQNQKVSLDDIINKQCEDYDKYSECKNKFCTKIHFPFLFYLPQAGLYEETVDIDGKIFQQYLKYFQKYIQDQKYYLYSTKVSKSKGYITIAFTTQKYLNQFTINTFITINDKLKNITSKAILSFSNGVFIKQEEQHIRLLIARYFIRLNSTFRFGCYVVNPISGEICLKMNSYMTKQLYKNIVSSDQNLSTHIKTLMYTSFMALEYHTRKILGMCNLIPSDYFLDQIKQQKLSDQKPKQRLPQEDCYKKLESIMQNLKSCHQKVNLDQMPQDKRDEYFKLPIQRASNGLSTKIYSELEIDESKIELNTNSFGSGGFADIYKAKIYYKNNNTGDYVLKTVAIKEEKKQDDQGEDNRVGHEIRILELLQEKECPYVSKFYYSKQQKGKLIMEFYPNKSFDHFKSNFSLTMTLNTKVYLLWQISQGIRFLNEQGIIHLDLKPANILISRNYIAKITDFGESYSKQICNSDFKPGRTIPYCAPEVLQNIQEDKYNNNPYFKINKDKFTVQYNEKSDIYSLGVIICDILFDVYPIEMKKGSQKNVQNKYKDNKYLYNLMKQYKNNAGPKNLMELFIILISKSLEEPEHRPYIERLIIILRDSLFYIERMY